MADNRKVFQSIDVFPNWVTGHFIQWKLDPFFRAEKPYNFSLEISETQNFSEVMFTKKNLGDVFFAIDDTNLKQSWAPNYHYRIILEAGDGSRYISPSVLFGLGAVDQRRFAMAAEIIRKETLLHRYVGNTAWLLRRKTYGTKKARTLKNIDPVSGVPIADTAFEDYGVGVDDGYFAPVPCVYYIENSQQDNQLDEQGLGVKENFTQIVRMLGYPIIEVLDIICDDADGSRYSVASRQLKNFPGTSIPLTQKANINLIPVTDTVYSISIPRPAK